MCSAFWKHIWQNLLANRPCTVNVIDIRVNHGTITRHAISVTMSRDRSNHSEDTGSDSVDSPCVNSDSVDSQRRAPAGSASALAPDPDQSRPHTTTVVSNWLPQVEHAEADHDIVEEPLAHGFSCPYHKRNPKRFNEHDYPYCATESYEDMTDLA